MAIKRTYPHVNMIKDPFLQQSLRALWDRVHTQTEELVTTKATLATAQATIATLGTDLEATTAIANQAALAAQPVTDRFGKYTGIGSGIGQPPAQPPPAPPASDDGSGEQGLAEAGATGHVDPSLPLTKKTAGLIVGGTFNEFSTLAVVTANQPDRDTNRAEMLNRMIWHLNLQGFPTSHYGTDPASPGYKFLLLIVIDGSQCAYKVTGYEEFGTAMTPDMRFGGTTIGQGVTPDGGTPD